MGTNDLLAIVIPSLALIITLYALGVKEIERRKTKDTAEIELRERFKRERIEAIVELHLLNKMDEFKKNYSDMINLIKSGTFK